MLSMLSYGVGWGGGGGGRRMEEKCKSMPKNEALGDKQLNFRYGREMGFPSGTVKKKKKKKNPPATQELQEMWA